MEMQFDSSGGSGCDAPPGNFGGNQAVLGALNSLQQKIKRLEQEREFYINTAQKARQHVESFKAETEQLREGEKRQHEELLRQREEELRRLKEDRPRLVLELQHAKEQALHTERLLEAERKDMTHKLADATACHASLRDETLVQQEKIRSLEIQLENERAARAAAEEGRDEAKQNIGEIISFNELLFSKVQELERPPPAPRKPRAGRSASATRRSHSAERHTISSQRRVRAASPKHGNAPPQHSASIHEKLKRINQGDIPFVPAGRVVAGESFNKMARVQNGLDLNVINSTLVKDGKLPPSGCTRRSGSRHADPMGIGMQDVYARFSQEYECINRRYREEIERMRRCAKVDPKSIDRLRTLSEELQAKGEDMRAFGEHESRVQEHLEAAQRPAPHIRGLDKRAKTLELFEEMKRIHSQVLDTGR